jgi:hypothetical protein
MAGSLLFDQLDIYSLPASTLLFDRPALSYQFFDRPALCYQFCFNYAINSVSTASFKVNLQKDILKASLNHRAATAWLLFFT